MKLSYDIIIPTYNGSRLLSKFLPHVLKAVDHSTCPGKITVVDDASTDDTVSMLQENFPDVNIIKRTKNGGFIENCETGVA
jgi:GT2 family glycosyltransferase